MIGLGWSSFYMIKKTNKSSFTYIKYCVQDNQLLKNSRFQITINHYSCLSGLSEFVTQLY